MDFAFRKLIREYQSGGGSEAAIRLANYVVRSTGGTSLIEYLYVCEFGPFLARVLEHFPVVKPLTCEIADNNLEDAEFNFTVALSDWCNARFNLVQSAWTLWPIEPPIEQPRRRRRFHRRGDDGPDLGRAYGTLGITLRDELHNLTYHITLNMIRRDRGTISLWSDDDVGDDFDEYLASLGFEITEDNEVYQDMGDRGLLGTDPELSWNNFIWWINHLNLVEKA